MVVNANAVSELVKIEERIFELLSSLDFSLDDDITNLTINYLKMFLSKEERIISELPIDDKEYNDSLIQELDDIIDDNVRDTDNSNYIYSRLFNFLYDCNAKIEPDFQYARVYDGETFYVKDNYVECDYNRKARGYYKNIMVRYIKSLEDLKDFGIYGENLLGVQKFNLFIERDLLREYVDCDFDVTKIKSLSEMEIRSSFGLDEKSFDKLKMETIYSKLFEMISSMFCNSVDTMYYLDAELNFKHFIYELSFDSLVGFVSMLDDFLRNYFENSGKKFSDFKDIISLIEKYLNDELTRKSSDNLQSFELSTEDYGKLKNFAFLEKEILSLIDGFDFDNEDLKSVRKLDSLLDIESEMVSDFSDISILDLSQFFNLELSNILSGDDSERIVGMINYRIFHLLPIFNSLFKTPGQSSESYEIIYRNYVISSLKMFYNLIGDIEVSDIKNTFYGVYKEQFYMNPFLTRLLVCLNGNHLMIEPFSFELSTELSKVDEFEYNYDLDNQLFGEALTVIQDLSMFDSCIQDLDSAYFHLKLIQFDYICHCLGEESLNNLAELLVEKYVDYGICEVLFNIVLLNLQGVDYGVDVSISSEGMEVNVLTLGGV